MANNIGLYGVSTGGGGGLTVGINGGTQVTQVNAVEFTGTAVSAITNPSAGIALVSINTGGGGGGGVTAPFVLFVSQNTGSANQTFQDIGLAAYGSNTSSLVVSVNGVILTPVVSYTLANTVLTIIDYLEPNSIIQCEPSSSGTGGGGGGGISTAYDFGTYSVPVEFTLDLGSYIF